MWQVISFFSTILVFCVSLLAGTAAFSQDDIWDEVSHVQLPSGLQGIVIRDGCSVFAIRGKQDLHVLSLPELELVNSIPIGFDEIHFAWDANIMLCKQVRFCKLERGKEVLTTSYFFLEASTGKLVGVIPPMLGRFLVEAISLDGKSAVLINERGDVFEHRNNETLKLTRIEIPKDVFPLKVCQSKCNNFIAIKWSVDIRDLPLKNPKEYAHRYSVITKDNETIAEYIGGLNLRSDEKHEFPQSFTTQNWFPSQGSGQTGDGAGFMVFEGFAVTDGYLLKHSAITVQEDGSLRKWRRKEGESK